MFYRLLMKLQIRLVKHGIRPFQIQYKRIKLIGKEINRNENE